MLPVLLFVRGAQAQEIAFAANAPAQANRIDLSVVPKNMPVQDRVRTGALAVMITGGLFTVAGIALFAAAKRKDPTNDQGYFLELGGITCLAGGAIAVVGGGVVFLASGRGKGRYSSHISVYGDPNRVGLAYNF